MVLIREASKSDLNEILVIYNEAVDLTVATFDTEHRTFVQQEKWLENHGATHPVIVAVDNGIIVGWASLSKWSDRAAYDGTVELSFYVLEKEQGKGIGKKLIHAIIEKAINLKYHTIISRITQGNEASIHLHKITGFEYIGAMKQVGRKFGRLLDVHLYQKLLK